MKSNNLKNLRNINNLKQYEIAQILNIARTTYRNYENNERQMPYELLIKIADYYKVSIDYILSHETKDQLQLGFLNEDKKNAIKKLIALNQINFVKAYSYISGLHAAQN